MKPNPLLDQAITGASPEAMRVAAEALAIIRNHGVEVFEAKGVLALDGLREILSEGPESAQWLEQELAQVLTNNKRAFKAWRQMTQGYKAFKASCDDDDAARA